MYYAILSASFFTIRKRKSYFVVGLAKSWRWKGMYMED